MKQSEQQRAAKAFAQEWEGRGYEKGDSQTFWLSLLKNVYGIEHPSSFIRFEEQTKSEIFTDNAQGQKKKITTNFIDGFIDATKFMIEQKSLGKDLREPIRQYDGALLSPFQQAKRYAAELPYSKKPRWIIACNFAEFHIYDMEKPRDEPEVVYLKDLEQDCYRLNFLVDTGDEHIQKEMEVSLQAGELVGVLYNALLKQYQNPEDPETLKNLNVLCVRLVFCLYAEDAGLFGKHGLFHDYLSRYQNDPDLFRDALLRLFRVLDQKPEERDPYLEDTLLSFPYVNGGLFANEQIVIPRLNPEIINILLNQASADFDWSEISPTIFGAVFESTLNPQTRRSGGMHYTSIENIHKVIDPLFLDDLKAELEEIQAIGVLKTRNRKLFEFQDKIASLDFFDPAAGSGNFLTETYLSLRRMENKVLRLLHKEQIMMGTALNPIRVSIRQFHGIEINDFAVTVAKTALWIAESQMMQETASIIYQDLDFLPLKTNANIVEGNALRLDWEEVVPREKLDYIMGNPPFSGRRYRTPEQIEDVSHFFAYKDIDYVACWFVKAADYMQGTEIQTAFVATNSICQGEQVQPLWQSLLEKQGIRIGFAHRTFVWNSESNRKAHVHCIIVGFSYVPRTQKFLFEGGRKTLVRHINGYLIDAPDAFIGGRSTPVCLVPKMRNGNVPLDGDALKIEEDELATFPNKKFIKKLIGGRELLHNKSRYVLWLVDAPPKEIHSDCQIMNRVSLCRKRRLSLRDRSSRSLADKPTLFRDTLNPDQYIALPTVSGERRQYIPMDFLDGETIPTNQVQIIPDATLYHFGILTSNVHMAWMRTVAGRLKSDYRYSKDIVYHNFPWPGVTPENRATPADEVIPADHRVKIEQTAQAILDARARYPEASLADLYDPLTMPPDLRKAHQENDKAVMTAYGFDWRTMTESECVAELMRLYQNLTGPSV